MSKRISDDLKSGKEIVEIIFKRPLFKKILTVKDLSKYFYDTVEDNFSQHVSLVDFKDFILYFQADSPLWSMEFGFKKKEILIMMNKKFGAGAFKDSIIRTKMAGKFKKTEKDKEKR